MKRRSPDRRLGRDVERASAKGATSPRLHVARIQRPALTWEETFCSKANADHWRAMVEETLDRPESRALDLPTYAHGLAINVRMYGGAKTREAWASARAPLELWARGLVHGYQLVEDQMRAVLAGRPIET